jgi:hypothetical protein
MHQQNPYNQQPPMHQPHFAEPPMQQPPPFADQMPQQQMHYPPQAPPEHWQPPPEGADPTTTHVPSPYAPAPEPEVAHAPAEEYADGDLVDDSGLSGGSLLDSL